jgi:hypothetical protein
VDEFRDYESFSVGYCVVSVVSVRLAAAAVSVALCFHYVILFYEIMWGM